MKTEYERIAEALIPTYAAELPENLRTRVFGLAWEHGHANGEGDIEFYFVDFADLAVDAYRAGIAAGNLS